MTVPRFARLGGGVAVDIAPVAANGSARTLTLDNTGQAERTDYQVPVDLTASNFTFTTADGADLRVTDGPGTTTLAHWIESYDQAAQTARLWVRVPSIPAGGTTALRLLSGNAALPTGSDPLGAARFGWGIDFRPGKGRTTRLTIPAQDRTDYGCSIPLTYIFAIPAGASGLTARWRDSPSGAWTELPVKTTSDTFNSVNAVRFDYPARRAYVSVAFTATSNELYLEVRNSGGVVVGSYLQPADRYDGRATAAIFTWDDLLAGVEDAYLTMATEAAARGIFVSVGINPLLNGNQPINDAKVQQLLDKGNVELVNHSYTHKAAADADYDATVAAVEVDSATAYIKARTLHPFNRNGSSQFVYAWIRPNGATNVHIDARLVAQKYLTLGRTTQSGPNIGYSGWNTTTKIHNVHPASYENVADLDAATMNAAFDAAVASGTDFIGYAYAQRVSFAPGSNMLQHFDHIKGKPRLWYVGQGHYFLYHYMTMRVAADGWSAPRGGRGRYDTGSGATTVLQTDAGAGYGNSLEITTEEQDATGTEVISTLRGVNAADLGLNLTAGLDVFRNFLNKADGRFYVQSFVNNVSNVRYNAARLAATVRTRLRLVGNTVTAFEGDTQRASLTWPLPTKTVRLSVRANGASGGQQSDAVDFIFARKHDGGADPTVTVGAAGPANYSS